ILRRDAVSHLLWMRYIRPFAPRSLDDVVFDAAAGHRSDDVSVFAHGEQGARRPRRAPPGLDDGYQQHALAFVQPLRAFAKNFLVDAVHAIPMFLPSLFY